MVFGRAATDWTPFTGGMHWQAVAYAIWESFFCIGVCLGLLVLFRDKYNTQGKLSVFSRKMPSEFMFFMRLY